MNFKKRNGRNSTTNNVVFWLMWFILVLYCLSIIGVVYWMVTASFKSYFEYTLRPYQFPQYFRWENYSDVFKYLYVKVTRGGQKVELGFFDLLGSSFLYSLLMPIPSLFWTVCFAYGISTFRRYWYNNFLYNLGILLMVVPLVGSLPISMRVAKLIGIYDNMPRAWLLSGGSFSGMRFLMLYGIFKNVSPTYREACLIDGGNNYTAFFRLSIPLVFPSIVCFYFLDFIAWWNNYETFLIWYPSYANLGYGMYVFQNNINLYGVGYPVVLAGFVLVSIPAIILYIVINQGLTKNLTFGGLKG